MGHWGAIGGFRSEGGQSQIFGEKLSCYYEDEGLRNKMGAGGPESRLGQVWKMPDSKAGGGRESSLLLRFGLWRGATVLEGDAEIT